MTRQELFDYAKALTGNSAAQVLVNNIEQAKHASVQALVSVKNVMVCIESNEAHTPFDDVPNLVHFATHYERAQERLAGLFLSLAQTLQSQGHKIDF